MAKNRLESLEMEFRKSYNENLEINLSEDSPLFSEIMAFKRSASANIKKMLHLN